MKTVRNGSSNHDVCLVCALATWEQHMVALRPRLTLSPLRWPNSSFSLSTVRTDIIPWPCTAVSFATLVLPRPRNKDEIRPRRGGGAAPQC